MRNRFKELYSVLGYNQQEMADKLSIDVRKLRSYIYETKNFPVDFLQSLVYVFNVNISWLLTGIGQMFNERCENSHKLRKDNKPENNYKVWGKRLARLLSENEITPYDFAKIVNIPEHKIERFILDSIEPTIKELNSIKSNVDISIDELLYGEIVEKSTQEDDVCLSANEILKLKELLKNS